MLADNILFLREEYPSVYSAIKNWENSGKEPTIFLENAKDSHLTMKYVKDDQIVYLHSKYNPIREAEIIIDKLADTEKIDDQTHVVFYGLGLGYHIDIFLLRFPTVSYSIIEPSPEIFAKYLDNKIIKRCLNRNLQLLQCGNQADALYNKAIQIKDKNLVICDLSTYQQIFKETHHKFLADLKHVVKEQRAVLHANYTFKKRWIINSVNNFKYVLQTPDVLLEKSGFFNGHQAILVAAGPSLDLEIENLNKIKDEGLAYVFSVGSAINTLVQHGIEPDAMCTYDPSEKNQIVFNKINELGIDNIPMIFGSSVGYEVLEQYPGPKYHMITNQDTVAAYFLRSEKSEPIEMVSDASTIAVVTLELLVKLGFSQIILVGQNLAYTEEKSYSSDIDYITDEMREDMLTTEGIFTKSVDGNQVKTTESFLNMKKQLEQTIDKYKAKVINTTIGGARIEGTIFKTLEQLIAEDLADARKKDYPLNIIKQTKKYDREYAIAQLDYLKSEYSAFQNLVTIIKNYLQELAKMNQEKEAHKTHLKMDKKIRQMEDNAFFKMIALPINRVEYGILFNAIQKTKAEKNNLKKAKNIIKPTETFINLLYTDMQLNDEIMRILENVIKDFV